VAIPVQASQPALLARPVELRFGPLGEAHEVGGVARLHLLGLSARLKLFEGIMAERFEHPHPRLVRVVPLPAHQALLDQ